MIGSVADTNVLARYALDDDWDAAAAVEQSLKRAAAAGEPVLIFPSTVSELVFVLRGSVYRRPRSVIAQTLETLLAVEAFEFIDRALVERAVVLYRDQYPDWDDCLVAAYALERGDGRVLSFDQGFDRIPGVTRVEPGA